VAGFELKVFNRDRAKTQSFADKNIEVASSLASLVRNLS
jgi:3-hydroxyisobutyrate dehydrogenase-like beta-hydroxyacid dehydrogenase